MRRRSTGRGGDTVRRATKLERTMMRVRWAGVGLGVFQVLTYRPPVGTPEPAYAHPLSYVLLAALALMNVVVAFILRRERGPGALRRVGLAAFAGDVLFLFGLVWLYNYEEFGATWVILYVASLEGALRYGMRGALWPVALAGLLEPVRELFRQQAFGFPFNSNQVTFRVGIMAIIALVAGAMAESLQRERAAAERRARLVGVVAAAARNMSSLDPEQVLGGVVGSGVELGFDATSIGIVDEQSRTYRIAYQRGLPPEYAETPQALDAGAHGRAFTERRTVIVDDYAASPDGMPQMRAAGFDAVISTPVWSGGRVAAILSGASKQHRPLGREEIAAFEALASHAGQALENARRFSDEQEAVARLSELDRLKRDFLSMVSHELRTPLTAIEGMGLTLADGWDALDEEVRKELVGRMNANSRALHDIITTLLDFSRLEAGRLEIQPSRVDLTSLLLQVAGRLEGLFANHHLSMDTDDVPFVEADPTLLERVIENLLSNAAKHTPPGTHVSLSVRVEAGSVAVAVEDDGPGIPEDEQRHLGERFYRGGDATVRATKGIGLGMALAREILRMHGSELEIESERGRGSKFGFRLPMDPAAGATPPQIAERPSATQAR